MKISILGYGYWGQKLENLIERRELFDVNILSKDNTEYKNPTIITTPPHTHAEFTIKVADSKNKVYLEKPICVNLEELKELDKRRDFIMVANKFIKSSAVNALKDILKDEKIQSISCHWLKAKFDEKVGITLDLGYHFLYTIFYLLDAYPAGITINKNELDTFSNINFRVRDIPCHIELFGKNPFSKFKFDISVNTDKATYQILLEDNSLILLRANKAEEIVLLRENPEFMVEKELKDFMSFVEGTYRPDLEKHFKTMELILNGTHIQ